jgi:hypothetical protein
MLVSLMELSHRLIEVLRQCRDEYQVWGLAGAKRLQDLKLHGIGASN